ncbi:hypothetical protein CASFOL_008164 [Castilleja foliolosa]|uniref:Uncharacterized protein n=1 Tax=Castilleja foliolosa TaxID=1961234 RepID=A0ABD3DY71_9LAMI
MDRSNPQNDIEKMKGYEFFEKFQNRCPPSDSGHRNGPGPPILCTDSEAWGCT